MQFKALFPLKLAFSAGFILLSLLLSGQSDSLNDVVDSVLLKQQKYRSTLNLKADSIKFSDSLEEVVLIKQISELKSQDKKRKEELLARYDSLQKMQALNREKIKRQVDSLRSSTAGVPVIFDKDTLFFIYSKIGPFSPTDRAKSISTKLYKLVDDYAFNPSSINISENEASIEIISGETTLLVINEEDAFWLDKPMSELAEEYQATIVKALNSYKKDRGLLSALIRFGLLIVVIGILYFGIRFLNKGFTKVNRWIFIKGKDHLKGITIKNYQILSEEREERMVVGILRILKWIIITILVYLALPTIFSIFPATKGIANVLFRYVWDPVSKFGSAFIGYIPNLITIVVIVFITRYCLKALRFLASEVESEKLVLPGFYSDWSKPTFNLLKIIIYAFSFIVIFPYLPGSDSPVFQGVSVFLGLIISLGSSSAIGNIIAGLVITYMRAFKIGDRVKIGDTVGDVIEKTMLVTRIRTIKNEDVSIPNLAINYSSSAKKLGLILNTTITIGYDVPWRTVHQLLIDAALKIEKIQAEPQPFVLQTSLDDFYVSYQINAYTENPESAAKIYSELHANIQDGFNEAGIEILSPHYRAARDGNTMAVPSEYLPKDYKTPSFNIKTDK